MKGLSRTLAVALLAGTVGACASKIHKADIPATAAPADEISRLESDINAGYGAQYDVLAPKEFSKSRDWLKEAKQDMASGEKQQEILDDIGYARAYLNKTKDIAEGRQAKLQGILDARKAAIDAGASNYPAQRERKYELDNRLRKVADDSKISTSRFNQLQNAYFDLELGAIQATQMDQAKAKVAGARRDGAEKNTPKLLRQAELDLANAYNVIAAHRHDQEGYRAAVDKANASAELLVDVLATSKRPGKDLSEDVALQMVMQGRQLANVKGQLSQQEQQAKALGHQLSQQEQQLSAAQAEQALNQALEEARKEFGKNEAEVYRQGDKLLIRLKSMKFPVGRSDLPAESLPILSKVKGIAEDLHPQSVVVEGHTDSTGSASLNQQLSQERAKAVAQYLETSGLEGEKIQTVGQGFQEPIASNKTKQGRAQNRRVDVIITPSQAAGSQQQQQQPQGM